MQKHVHDDDHPTTGNDPIHYDEWMTAPNWQQRATDLEMGQGHSTSTSSCWLW